MSILDSPTATLADISMTLPPLDTDTSSRTIESPLWPSFSPGSSPMSAGKVARADVAKAATTIAARAAPATPPRAIGGKIPSLRPSPGSLVMNRTPPSVSRSGGGSRTGRNRAKQAVARPLSTRGAASDVIMPMVPVNVRSTPPRSAKKAKQRRYRQ
jgi:hypothetical protein